MGLLSIERGSAGYLAEFVIYAAASDSRVMPAARYGVTSAFWNVVFRTNGRAISRATS